MAITATILSSSKTKFHFKVMLVPTYESTHAMRILLLCFLTYIGWKTLSFSKGKESLEKHSFSHKCPGKHTSSTSSGQTQ